MALGDKSSVTIAPTTNSYRGSCRAPQQMSLWSLYWKLCNLCNF